MLDEEAHISEVRYLHGEHGRICGRHKREGGYSLPKEVCTAALCYRCREASGWSCRSQQRA